MNTKNKSNLWDILLQLPRLLLICSFIGAVTSGLLISLYYIPTPQSAALSIQSIQEQIFAGTSILNIHRICGTLVILFTVLNCILILPVRKISQPWIKTGQSGILLLLLFACFSITGYLLLGNNTAALIMKSMVRNISSAQTQGVTALSLILIRVYILHVIILPLLVGWFLYRHVRNTRELLGNIYPLTVNPFTLGSLFTAVLLGISFFVRPIEEPVAPYAQDFLLQAPLVIRNLVFIGKAIPIPLIIASIVLLLLIIWSAGYILGKGKE